MSEEQPVHTFLRVGREDAPDPDCVRVSIDSHGDGPDLVAMLVTAMSGYPKFAHVLETAVDMYRECGPMPIERVEQTPKV